MNIENLDYFLNELSEEELKSCTGGSALDSVINGTQKVVDYNINNGQNTLDYHIDGTQEGLLPGVQGDVKAIADIAAG